MTKIAAIYNVWDGDELLKGSVQSVQDYIDHIVIVCQSKSNFGEAYIPDVWPPELLSTKPVHYLTWKPKIGYGRFNEIGKRNIGIDKARELGCTHFLHMDCDEYYQNFGEAVQLYLNTGCDGSVCRMWTYFKKPTLRLEKPEGYYVPFIHKLHPHTKAGGMSYPFYVDPTRRINTSDVVELPIFMHHYSYVRKNVNRKIRNSTARKNLLNSCVLDDYNRDLKGGDYVKYYEQKLVEVEDIFNINQYL
jgi:hypothetical protein